MVNRIKNLMISRAKWKGSRYLQQRDGRWREPRTGDIYSTATSKNPIGNEGVYDSPYGSDKSRRFSKKTKKNFIFDEGKKVYVKRHERKGKTVKPHERRKGK